MQLRYLSLADTAVKDLTPLEGMPLVVVNLSRTKVSLDLSPITNAPIRALRLDTTPFTNVAQIAALQIDDLNLIDTPVADLSALSRLRLIYLSLDETRVVDLRPLEFMPLERLGLAGTPIKDISVLRGKHLKVLYLARCAQLRDLSPLGDCRDLEELSLPLNHGDIEFLRQLPRLKNLGYDSPPPPAADFWREYDARKNVPK
jgi:Leucine-rich repeat (LRR) protein